MLDLGAFTITPDLLKVLQRNLEAQEGRQNCIYPDSEGNPTTGIGHLLAQPCDAMSLPFVRKDGEKATQAEINAAYQLVKTTGRECRLVILPEEAIDAVFLADITEKARMLHHYFGEVKDIPQPAVLALFDMGFNLGGFLRFPKFRMAVLIGDWQLAAQECRRQGIGERRNIDTRTLFLQAAKLPPTQRA